MRRRTSASVPHTLSLGLQPPRPRQPAWTQVGARTMGIRTGGYSKRTMHMLGGSGVLGVGKEGCSRQMMLRQPACTVPMTCIMHRCIIRMERSREERAIAQLLSSPIACGESQHDALRCP